MSEKKQKAKMIEVTPLKDFSFKLDKEYHLKKDEKCEVPEVMKANLKTEKVIK